MNVDPDTFKKYVDFSWDWYYMARYNKSINYRLLVERCSDQRAFDYISMRLTQINIIVDNPTAPWNWNRLSCNAHLPIEKILDHENLSWNWDSFRYRIHKKSKHKNQVGLENFIFE